MLRGLAKIVGIAVIIACLWLVFIPCPPWSLKGIIARRTSCMANLNSLCRTLEQRGIPLDHEHIREIQQVVLDSGLTCAEGSDVQGSPALYYVVRLRNGTCVITEEAGNHPARERFLAGAVPEERFEIDAEGTIRSRAPSPASGE